MLVCERCIGNVGSVQFFASIMQRTTILRYLFPEGPIPGIHGFESIWCKVRQASRIRVDLSHQDPDPTLLYLLRISLAKYTSRMCIATQNPFPPAVLAPTDHRPAATPHIDEPSRTGANRRQSPSSKTSGALKHLPGPKHIHAPLCLKPSRRPNTTPCNAPIA